MMEHFGTEVTSGQFSAAYEDVLPFDEERFDGCIQFLLEQAATVRSSLERERESRWARMAPPERAVHEATSHSMTAQFDLEMANLLRSEASARVQIAMGVLQAAKLAKTTQEDAKLKLAQLLNKNAETKAKVAGKKEQQLTGSEHAEKSMHTLNVLIESCENDTKVADLQLREAEKVYNQVREDVKAFEEAEERAAKVAQQRHQQFEEAQERVKEALAAQAAAKEAWEAASREHEAAADKLRPGSPRHSRISVATQALNRAQEEQQQRKDTLLKARQDLADAERAIADGAKQLKQLESIGTELKFEEENLISNSSSAQV